MIRLLVTSSLLLTAYAQQVSLEIFPYRLDTTQGKQACTNDNQCPGGSHVRCTTENNLWGDGSTAKCIAQSYETVDGGAKYTSKEATRMLTKISADGTSMGTNCLSVNGLQGDRCIKYTAWLQAAEGVNDIDGCKVTSTKLLRVVWNSFNNPFTAPEYPDFNGKKRYACTFTVENDLYIGDAGLKVEFTAGDTTRSEIDLKFLVAPGSGTEWEGALPDPVPSATLNLLEMYANTGAGGAKHGITDAAVTADLRGNQFSYDLHLRDKRYKVKDDSGRRLLADRHAVSLAATQVEVLDAMKPLGTAWSLVAKYDDATEAFIMMQAASQACDAGDILDFGEAADDPACPASGYEDYVLYSLKGTFAFKVDLPSFRKAYLNATCDLNLCEPKLTFTVGTLSTVVRDLVLPTLLDDSTYSINVDLITPVLKNQRTTIEENELLQNFYRVDPLPTPKSNLLEDIDLDDLQFTKNGGVAASVAGCNAASMKVYEILAASLKNKADKLYKNADSALKSASCKAPAITLGATDTLTWGATSDTFIGDDGAVVTFDGIVVSHDRLSVIRATSVELDGSKTTFLNVKSNPEEQYDFHSLESSVVDDQGTSITKAITLTTTEGSQFIHTAGCNGYVDIQLRRNPESALKYDLRVPCERSTGKSVIDLTLKAEFASEYDLLSNVWGSSANYDTSAITPAATFGTCVPGVDGVDTMSPVGTCLKSFTNDNSGTFSSTMTVSEMKNCATVYQENYAPNENGVGDYRFETTLAMVQGTAGGFRHCSDRKFVTVINRDATASTTSVSIAEVAQEAVLVRTANVKNIEWVQCNNGDSLFKQRIDISVEHTVNGVDVAYDLTSIESQSNSDNLALSIITDNGVEIVRMESACVQVTATECATPVGTEYGALQETSTEFILSGTYTGDDGGNEHQTRITVGTNYQSCPVDGVENPIDALHLEASITCDGGACAAEIEPTVPISTAVVLHKNADNLEYTDGAWRPETLDIKLVRKSLGGVVLSTDHVCDCDHDPNTNTDTCIAQNNNYGFYLFQCTVTSNGGTFEFDSDSLAGYYGDSSFEVHFEMVLYGGSAGRRLRAIKKMKASPGLEAEVDNIRVLPATMAAKLDSEPSNHTEAPKESPTEAPKEDTHTMTTGELIVIIICSIAGGAIIVFALSWAGCLNCGGGGPRNSGRSGTIVPSGYRKVGRAVRFKEINY